MLKDISTRDAGRLGDFLRESGYDEETLKRQGYLKQAPSARSRNLPRLMDRTKEPTRLNVLLRWFWLGVPQDATRAAAVPDWFTELALGMGLLRRSTEGLASEVMLFPADGFLLVCDHSATLGPSDPDFVLWPNPTSHLLSHFTVRRLSRSTLDLGTGNAIQALSASRHSERVVATDLNPRAITYAKFAAALNGVANVECLGGEGFAPVLDGKFDLIVCNPPFFISPARRHTFCDSSMDLDQLCRHFVKQAPVHLEEGGYFQMICEWAQIGNESWQEHVMEWVESNGCDAWILKVHTEDPADYALSQIAVTAGPSQRDDEVYDEHVGYYRERDVRAIHSGIIALRRRSGQNWRMLEEFADIPREPFGSDVLAIFAAQDFLNSHLHDEQILSQKLRLSPSCRLEQFFRHAEGQWQPTSLTLRLTQGFPFFVTLESGVAGLLSACDGSRTAREVIHEFARQVDAPLETVQTECVKILRRLIERGFVACSDCRAAG